MRLAAVLAFLAAVLPLIATPGASLTLLVREVTVHGRRRAVPVILGTVSGLYVHATLAAVGLSALVMHSSQAFEIVRLGGAAYLVALGVQCWRAGPVPRSTAGQDPDSRSGGAVTTYRHAISANVLNPKAASIFLTLVPQFLDPHRPLAVQIFILATAQSLPVCAWLAIWTTLLSGAGRILNSKRVKETWNRVSALVLIGLGIREAIT